MKKLQDLQVTDVLKAYDGAPGCMCGCNGDYLTTKESRAEADAERGYPYDDEDVRPDDVLRVLRLVQSAGDSAIIDTGIYEAKIEGRVLIVYLTAAATAEGVSP